MVVCVCVTVCVCVCEPCEHLFKYTTGEGDVITDGVIVVLVPFILQTTK